MPSRPPGAPPPSPGPRRSTPAKMGSKPPQDIRTSQPTSTPSTPRMSRPPGAPGGLPVQTAAARTEPEASKTGFSDPVDLARVDLSDWITQIQVNCIKYGLKPTSPALSYWLKMNCLPVPYVPNRYSEDELVDFAESIHLAWADLDTPTRRLLFNVLDHFNLHALSWESERVMEFLNRYQKSPPSLTESHLKELMVHLTSIEAAQKFADDLPAVETQTHAYESGYESAYESGAGLEDWQAVADRLMAQDKG